MSELKVLGLNVPDLLNEGLKALPREKRLVKLSKSATLTTVFNGDVYRKMPYMGVESFHIESVYKGKSGKLIFQLKQLTLEKSDLKGVEIPSDKMDELIIGYRNVRQAALELGSDIAIKKNDANAESKEAETNEGSKNGNLWGIFA